MTVSHQASSRCTRYWRSEEFHISEISLHGEIVDRDNRLVEETEAHVVVCRGLVIESGAS